MNAAEAGEATRTVAQATIAHTATTSAYPLIRALTPAPRAALTSGTLVCPYCALTVALTASGLAPGDLAWIRNEPWLALVAERWTTTFRVTLAPGARVPVENVPALTCAVTLVGPSK